MKKVLFSLALSLFVFSGQVFAQVPLTASPVGSNVLNSKIGVAAGVRGQVTLDRGGAVGQMIKSGKVIFLGDKIETGPKASLQILLLDETTFTIGSSSAIVVDEFIYDPSTDAGKVAVSVVEGTFRFITGKIGNKNPKNMKVDLPNGTIAIRGTMVLGRVAGSNSLVVLTGPGDKNNTGSKRGSVLVGGRGSDGELKFVRVAKTGFGTEIDGNNPPSLPFQVPENVLGEMSSGLNPQSNNNDGDDGNANSNSGGGSGSQASSSDDAGDGGLEVGDATDLAGQSDIDAEGDIDGFDSFFDLSEDAGDLSEQSSQDFFDLGSFFDGHTSIDELDAIRKANSGIQGIYEGSGDLFDNADNVEGDFNIHYHIDFDNRSVGGHDSELMVNIDVGSDFAAAGDNFDFDLTEQSFDEGLGGEAIFVYEDLSSSCTAGTCTSDVSIAFQNNDGVVADTAIVVADISNGTVAKDLVGVLIADRIE